MYPKNFYWYKNLNFFEKKGDEALDQKMGLQHHGILDIYRNQNNQEVGIFFQ